MTDCHYPRGCGGESQVRGRASPNASNSNNAWTKLYGTILVARSAPAGWGARTRPNSVNFNNGNDNWNNKNNTNHVRLVRAGEWNGEGVCGRGGAVS